MRCRGRPFLGCSGAEYGACNHHGKTVDSLTTTLQPGVYCGGLTIKGNANVTFAPGEYIIKDGKFFVDSNSKVSGQGVGFFRLETALCSSSKATVR